MEEEILAMAAHLGFLAECIRCGERQALWVKVSRRETAALLFGAAGWRLLEGELLCPLCAGEGPFSLLPPP